MTENQNLSVPSKVAENRADFIKRLFAVAISVGFANHVSALRYVEELRMPQAVECREAVLLLAAMIFVIGSWEGYFRSIAEDTLEDFPRFFLDIVIVFEYLILLKSAHDIEAFTRIVVVIFVTYFIWDWFKLARTFGLSRWDGLWRLLGRLARGFVGSILYRVFTSDRTALGPIITLWWAGYFLALALLVRDAPDTLFWPATAAAVWGALLYRLDKIRRYGRITRLSCIALPLAALATLLHSDPDVLLQSFVELVRVEIFDRLTQ